MNQRAITNVMLSLGCAVALFGRGGGGRSASSSSASSGMQVPNLTTDPSSTTVAMGQTAVFSASAIGSGPLTYQWQKNGTAEVIRLHHTACNVVHPNWRQLVICFRNWRASEAFHTPERNTPLLIQVWSVFLWGGRAGLVSNTAQNSTSSD